MIKKLLFLFCFFCCTATLYAQQSALPAITVKNINNRIIVSWVNNYIKPIVNLNIQRSYDSLKNFATIGEVLSPQSKENGYVDPNPPYTKMYYRVFVAFEGGSYVITPSAKPVKDLTSVPPAEKYPWIAEPVLEDTVTATVIAPAKPPLIAPVTKPVTKPVTNPVVKPVKPPVTTPVIIKPTDPADTITVEDNPQFPIVKRPKDSAVIVIIPAKPENTYPSMFIFTARDNNVVIHLPEAATKKYTVKFFDDNNRFLFELKKLKEEYLIIEKVNFVHTGWFKFVIYDNGEVVEENKFQITKDTKDPKKL